MTRKTSLLPPLLAGLLLLSARALPAVPAAAGRDGVEVKRGELRLAFDPRTGEFDLFHDAFGKIVEHGRVLPGPAEGPPAFAEAGGVRAEASRVEPRLLLRFPSGTSVRLSLEEGGLVMGIEGPAEKERLRFALPASRAAFPALLRDDRDRDRNVLVTTLGPAPVPGAAALFLPGLDLALSVRGGGKTAWRFEKGTWRLETVLFRGRRTRLRLWRDYYVKNLGLPFYAPMERRSFWKTAPVVAMTWYGVCGMKRPQDLALLAPEIDWVAKHLLPYAERIVFQLDDNYDFRDDKAMRRFSDYIRSKGLIPGVWFTPFGTAPEALFRDHPDWFLRDAEGKPLYSFGGVNWHWAKRGSGSGVIDTGNPAAVEGWYAPFWRRVSETWNFDFFKIDGQPTAVAAFRKAYGAGGVDRYRKGLAAARRIVGPDKFINGCWGMALEGVGTMNGSRTGGDTGYHAHALGVVIGNNYLNNVVWWCDPDAAAVLYDKPVPLVRLNAQARALTGQQFLTDDFWTRVPPEVCYVWQRAFPGLDLRPANLYPIGKEWRGYDLFDLRIAGPAGTRDVVGAFNFEGEATWKTLDLGRLPLEAKAVFLFDFWNQAFLGRFPKEARLTLPFDPNEGRLFAATPVPPEARPALLSTDRHVSQGGLDLAALAWTRAGEGWIARGRSTHLVPGDPYTLAFAAGPFHVAEARVVAPEGTGVEVERRAGIHRVRILPSSAGVEWEVRFERLKGPALGLFPERVALAPGMPACLRLWNRGPGFLPWKAVPARSGLRVEPAEGRLEPGAGPVRLALSTAGEGLEPGARIETTLTLSTGDALEPRMELPVTILVPLPENLARRAKASASSTWDGTGAYAPARAVDGRKDTRWNSARGDVNGAWLELAWDEPVTFDRVRVRECTDFGPRVRKWRMEAGEAEARTLLARGEGLGEACEVILDQPVTARRVRLVVEQASETPTIREVEVYRWNAGPSR